MYSGTFRVGGVCGGGWGGGGGGVMLLSILFRVKVLGSFSLCEPTCMHRVHLAL